MVAAQLYVEMLQGGYTQVCEFHYLHHSASGAPYADPATMAWAVADAAADAGLGLTLLPVLYERAGFAQPALRHDQRRFAGTPGFIADLQKTVQASGRALLNAGISIHSLRAASPASIQALLQAVGEQDLPIHLHIAEQMQEVRDCLAHTGQRPIAWLAQSVALDARWQLVHATHADASDIAAVARSGAGIVICPSTEGNLGDGLADLPAWLQQGVPLAIGSDSQVCRQWMEELRWLEYGQRLQLQRRNVAARPGQAEGASAARLFDAALQAGAQAAGQKHWGLQVGARADMLVLNAQANGLLGGPASHVLDAAVFACDSAPLRDVCMWPGAACWRRAGTRSRTPLRSALRGRCRACGSQRQRLKRRQGRRSAKQIVQEVLAALALSLTGLATRQVFNDRLDPDREPVPTRDDAHPGVVKIDALPMQQLAQQRLRIGRCTARHRQGCRA
jgi:formimidoylglutamate deiminase